MQKSFLGNFYKRKDFLFALVAFCVLVAVFIGKPWGTVTAAAEVISCNDVGSRTLTVGTYTDSDGSQFSSGADLTLNVGTSSTCIFEISLLGTDSAVSLGSLHIESGVTLSHDYAPTTDGTYYKLDLDITGDLIVDSGASIDVSGKGLKSTSGGSGYGFSSDGLYIATSYGSSSGNGGSHGGSGGKYSFFGGLGNIYDSVSNPTLPGSSGAAFAAGATGGGVVLISAASTTINGTINASGRDYAFSGNGAGGTVYLNITNDINGSGTISANGGASLSVNGAGGGGRVALYYTNFSNSITVQAAGGNSAVSFSDGAAGTIFKKPSGQTYGDLVLGSGSASESYYSTQLVYPVPTADSVTLYGGAYVFNSVTLSDYAVLDFSSSLDPNGTGVSSPNRKIYVVNTASCSANYNDTSLSNGQIQYNIGYVADPSGYQSNYVCVAPEYVIELSSTTSTAKESVSSGSFEVRLPAVYGSDVTVDYAVYAPSSTATGGGVDYTLAAGTLNIASGDTTNTVSFSITDDTAPESDEDFVFEISNPSFGVIGGNSRFTYTIDDNDTPGVTLNEGTGVSVSEGVAIPDTYTVVLDSIPSADVVITPHGDEEVTVSPSSLTFTTANWDTPQTIEVLAVNDGYAESSHSGTITHSVSSTDLGYEGLSVSSVTVSISDNDFAGVTVAPSGGSTYISENGRTDTYTLVLNTIPSADVTINISSDADSTVSTSSIVFTSSNWNTPKTITITAVDDEDSEGAHSSNISHSSVSDDSSYNSLFISGVFAQVIDNETASVTIFPTRTSVSVREGVTTDTYTINLETAPTGDVVITPDGGTDMSVSPTSVTFTSSNWLTPQTITVTAVDDASFEGSESLSISHSAASTDTNYDNIYINGLSVSAYDNDGFTTTESDGSTDITEGAGADTVDVVLDENPYGDVTITLATSTEYSLSTTTLYFHMSDWDTPQTFSITAVDDTDIEGNETVYVSSTLSTYAFKYTGTIFPSIAVNITDDDTPAVGVTVTESSSSTDITEGGSTDSYTIELNSAPAADVTITITPDADSTVSTSSIVFTSSNWNTPQTITVTPVDDFIAEGSHASTITHASASTDVNYDGLTINSVISNVTDNDSTSFNLNGFTFNTVEGGSSILVGVELGSEPTANVYIPVSSSDTTEGTLATSSVTITPLDWNSMHYVTVTPVDDFVVDGDIDYNFVFGAATSADPFWNAQDSFDPTITNTDNDVAGVTVSESSSTTDISEAGTTDSYTMVLASQPTFSVTVDISTDGETSLSTSSLTFTTDNWSTPQTVTVTAENDNIAEGSHSSTISHSVTSDDSSYNGVAVSSVTANITDNDTAGITVSTISGNTTEDGGTATFTVVLTSRPTANVDIPISSSDTSEGTVSTSSLRFNPGNWNTSRTITVTGADDNVVDGSVVYSIVVGSTTSGDTNYNGVNPNDVSVTNTDNDVAGITITESSGATNITEGGTTDSYTLVLDTQPTSDVTITITPDSQSTVSTSSITFTSGNWDAPQSITVTAVNDSVVEDPHTSTISSSVESLDLAYNGVSVSDVVANITDNDTAGFTVSAISGNTTEAGGTATFTVVLTSQPTGIVTTTVHSSNTSEGTVNTSTLVFNAASWNLARTVTVTGVNDSVDDGDISYTIILDTATSTDDTNYNGINPNNVNVTNTDNDTVGVTVSDISGNTTEAGGTATFTVVLNTQPTGTVEIPLSTTDSTEGTITTTTLAFDYASWNLSRTVTVTGVNDDVDDGDVSYSIVVGTVSSTDGLYSGVNPGDVSIVNMNEDIAGVTLAETDDETLVGEDGTTDTYTVVLDSEPTANVTVGIATDGDTNVSSDSLTFTSENWDTPQSITITALDDEETQGTHSSMITHTVESDDTDYNGVEVSSLTVSIEDNEVSIVEPPVSHNGNSDGGEQNSDNSSGSESESGSESSPDVSAPVGSENSGIPYSEQIVSLKEQTRQEVKIGNQKHHVTRISATETSATIVIESTPVQVTLFKNETKLVDTDADKVVDMSVTYSGFIAGVPQFIFQDVTASSGGRIVVINKDALLTTSTQVLLTFDVTSTPLFAISNTSSFAGSTFQPFRKTFFWNLTPGNGTKTVYVRFQRKNGYLFDASDTIELKAAPGVIPPPPILPESSICNYTVGRPIKVKNSPAVYLVDKAHTTNGGVDLGIPCAKRLFSSPIMYFSYFGSWSDIQVVSPEQMESIPDDVFRFIPLGPRYTPREGSLFKTIGDSKVYILLGAQKHWIETEVVFRTAGYIFDWVKTVVNSLADNIPTGDPIGEAGQIPVDLQGKNMPITTVPPVR